MRWIGRLAIGVVFLSAVAHADTIEACIDAADQSQKQRDSGQWVEARESLLACSESTCPQTISKQCSKWLYDLDTSMPTIVVRVREAEHDVSDAVILVDNIAKAQPDGKAIAVNPGPHVVVAHREGWVDAEAHVVVVSGEKNRAISLEPTKPPPLPMVAPTVPVIHTTQASRSFVFPWYAGTLLGLGAASFVATTALVISAGDDADTMRSSCAPACAQSDVDAARTKLIVANVLLGVGILSVTLSAGSLIYANVHSAPTRTGWSLIPRSNGLDARWTF